MKPTPDCEGCIYTDLIENLREEYKTTLVYKDNSKFMRLLNVLLLIVTFGGQRQFMTRFTTTIGKTIYVPREWEQYPVAEKITILRHERIHLRQAKRYPLFVFSFLYLFFPLPLFLAYYRAKFEKEAYEESMRSDADLYGGMVLYQKSYSDFIQSQFTSSAYGWMWPFKDSINKWYLDTVERILVSKK